MENLKKKYEFYDICILKKYELGDVHKDIHDGIIRCANEQNRELNEIEKLIVNDCEKLYPLNKNDK